MKRHLLIAAAVATVTIVGLSACSSGSTGSGSSSAPSTAVTGTGATGSLASLVPAEYAGKTLSAVDGDSNPPLYSRTDSGELTGITLDLANAAADLLGVKIDAQQNSFDASIPGVQSGKYDISLWATDLTADRMKVLDQIPIGAIGYTFLIKSDGTELPSALTDICGITVAAIAGQTTLPAIQAQSDACVAAGKEPITASTFPDQATSNLAVKSGRADAVTINSVSGVAVAQKDPTLKISGPVFNKHLTGIATNKGNGLGDAFAKALQALIDDGTYQKIISGYGADSMEVTSITVNPSLG